MNLRGQPDWEGNNKQNPQITYLKATPSLKVPPDARIHHQQVGAEWREAGGIA